MQYDYVIVGGGSAGCVLASRLSEDRDATVLLLEAGGEGGGFWERLPLGVGKVLNQTDRIWRNSTEPSVEGLPAAMPWVSGKGLGGSSAVNAMLFVRGHSQRYDLMAAQGCHGWDYQSCLPAFRRMEDFPEGTSPDRGRNGPVGVTRVEPDPISDAFLEACADSGFGRVEDYNDSGPDGASYLQLSARKGWRSSAARAYLDNVTSRPNLTIRTRARARRILFEGRAANGVEFVDDRTGQLVTVRAQREVLVAAGAVRSPALLERSGIGDRHRLESLGIQVVADRPEVGENLQDHFMPRVCFETPAKGTVNHMLNSIVTQVSEALKFATQRTGMFSNSSLKATAFVRSHESMDHPDLRLQVGLMSAEHRVPSQQADRGRTPAERSGLDPHSSFHIGVYGLYPDARGSTHIGSSQADGGELIRPNYLAAATDRAAVTSGLRIVNALAAKPVLRELIRREIRPNLAGACDEDLLRYAMRTGHTCWHPTGTCRMGDDSNAVVDVECRVNGVDRLRVVDASVFPFMVSSNTNAPVLMLAERISELAQARPSALVQTAKLV